MNLKVIGSSSKGNCYLLETQTGTLMLDCGCQWKDIQQGLSFDIRKVTACLVTHSHQDHCKRAQDIVRMGIEVYMSQNTALELSLNFREYLPVYSNQEFQIGDFKIMPFLLEHDVTNLGYLIQYIPTGEKLIYCTDTYYIRYIMPALNFILVECNYVKETLDQNVADGVIDLSMKNRLLKSHFSLEHLKEFLQANDLSKCTNIVLIHLSDTNSDAGRIQREVQELTQINTVIADKGMNIQLGCGF